MEQIDEKQILAEEEELGKIDPEELARIKAMFEHEMTGVMLNLRGKFDRVEKGSIQNEYLETEIEKPQLSYDSPEIEVSGIGCELPETKITLSDTELKAELPFVEAISFDAAKPELPVLPVIGDDIIQAAVQVPVISDAYDFAGFRELQPADPEEMRAAIADRMPEPAENYSAAALAAAAEKMTEENSIRISVSVETADPPQCAVIPETEWNDIRVTVPDASVDHSVFTMASAEIPVAPVPVEIQPGSVDGSSFVLPPPGEVEIKIQYEPVKANGFQIPSLPVRSVTVQEYPEVPEMPDYSNDISGILAAVKGEI